MRNPTRNAEKAVLLRFISNLVCCSPMRLRWLLCAQNARVARGWSFFLARRIFRIQQQLSQLVLPSQPWIPPLSLVVGVHLWMCGQKCIGLLTLMFRIYFWTAVAIFSHGFVPRPPPWPFALACGPAAARHSHTDGPPTGKLSTQTSRGVCDLPMCTQAGEWCAQAGGVSACDQWGLLVGGWWLLQARAPGPPSGHSECTRATPPNNTTACSYINGRGKATGHGPRSSPRSPGSHGSPHAVRVGGAGRAADGTPASANACRRAPSPSSPSSPSIDLASDTCCQSYGARLLYMNENLDVSVSARSSK